MAMTARLAHLAVAHVCGIFVYIQCCRFPEAASSIACAGTVAAVSVPPGVEQSGVPLMALRVHFQSPGSPHGGYRLIWCTYMHMNRVHAVMPSQLIYSSIYRVTNLVHTGRAQHQVMNAWL